MMFSAISGSCRVPFLRGLSHLNLSSFSLSNGFRAAPGLSQTWHVLVGDSWDFSQNCLEKRFSQLETYPTLIYFVAVLHLCHHYKPKETAVAEAGTSGFLLSKQPVERHTGH